MDRVGNRRIYSFGQRDGRVFGRKAQLFQSRVHRRAADKIRHKPKFPRRYVDVSSECFDFFNWLLCFCHNCSIVIPELVSGSFRVMLKRVQHDTGLLLYSCFRRFGGFHGSLLGFLCSQSFFFSHASAVSDKLPGW